VGEAFTRIALWEVKITGAASAQASGGSTAITRLQQVDVRNQRDLPLASVQGWEDLDSRVVEMSQSRVRVEVQEKGEMGWDKDTNTR
jgi:hypothetical protein